MPRLGWFTQADAAPGRSGSARAESENWMKSKKRTTMAKLNRERSVKEKRDKKRAKKEAAAAERARIAAGLPAGDEMTPAESSSEG